MSESDESPIESAAPPVSTPAVRRKKRDNNIQFMTCAELQIFRNALHDQLFIKNVGKKNRTTLLREILSLQRLADTDHAAEAVEMARKHSRSKEAPVHVVYNEVEMEDGAKMVVPEALGHYNLPCKVKEKLERREARHAAKAVLLAAAPSTLETDTMEIKVPAAPKTKAREATAASTSRVLPPPPPAPTVPPVAPKPRAPRKPVAKAEPEGAPLATPPSVADLQPSYFSRYVRPS
jgi:hypothetical protein